MACFRVGALEFVLDVADDDKHAGGLLGLECEIFRGGGGVGLLRCFSRGDFFGAGGGAVAAERGAGGFVDAGFVDDLAKLFGVGRWGLRGGVFATPAGRRRCSSGLRRMRRRIVDDGGAWCLLS
jgi:hypothetical protein